MARTRTTRRRQVAAAEQVAPATAEQVAADLAAHLADLTAATAAARADRWREQVAPAADGVALAAARPQVVAR